MKKLLALSGLASSVSLWATTVAVPKLLAIVLVLFYAGSLGSYTFASSGVGSNIVGYAFDYFKAGGITASELILGL